VLNENIINKRGVMLCDGDCDDRDLIQQELLREAEEEINAKKNKEL